jgi:hypothetical protein
VVAFFRIASALSLATPLSAAVDSLGDGAGASDVAAGVVTPGAGAATGSSLLQPLSETAATASTATALPANFMVIEFPRFDRSHL